MSASNLSPDLEEKPAEALVSFYYDLAIIEYCGLSAKGIGAEIERQKKRLKSELKADQKDMEIANKIARKDIFEEWNNRGVGGFAHWCRTEGVRALQRLTPGPEQPVESDHEF